MGIDCLPTSRWWHLGRKRKAWLVHAPPPPLQKRVLTRCFHAIIHIHPRAWQAIKNATSKAEQKAKTDAARRNVKEEDPSDEEDSQSEYSSEEEEARQPRNRRNRLLLCSHATRAPAVLEADD